jgi:hypothetical protein
MTHAGESRHDETGSRRERRADRNGGAETKRVDRRRFLVGTAAAAAGLAGCPTDLGASRSFSATPVVLPPGARSEAGYEQVTVETISSEESRSVSDVEYEATIESHLSVYEPTGQPLTDAEAPAVAYPGVGALSTPDASVDGDSLNPLTTKSLRSVLAGDALSAARAQILTRLGGVGGSDPSWVRGPSSVAVGQHVESLDGGSVTGEFLGGEVSVEVFGGVARGGGTRYAVLVYTARRAPDDVVIVSAVLDRELAESDGGDAPLVGADGYFPSESLAGGLSAFLDALPRFVFKQSGANGATTTTASGAGSTTTSTRTTSTAGSSGGATVIDDFEDADTTEYRQLGIVNASFVNTPTERGSTALSFTNMYSNYGLESTSGLANYPHQGDRFRAWFRFDGATQGQTLGMEFGKDAQGRRYSVGASKGSSGNQWTVTLRGHSSGGNGSFTASLSAGTWYGFEVAWGPATTTATLVDGSGNALGSTSVTATGDNGDDLVAFRANPGSNTVYWDYAHVVGQVRQYPAVIDDFEDGNVSEYNQSGLMNPSVVNTPTKDGSQALQFTQTSANYGLRSTSGLANYPHQGDRFRVWFRFDSASQGTLFRFTFGLDANGSAYYAEASKTGSGNNWQVTLANGQGGSSQSTVSLSSGAWYAFDIAWGAGTIQADVIDANETTLTSTSMAGTGDQGDDHISYRVDTGQNNFYWDEARIVGRA